MRTMTKKADWTVLAFLAACVAIPLLGCVIAVRSGNVNWLWMLAPLFIFMEGGIALILVAFVVVAWIIG